MTCNVEQQDALIGRSVLNAGHFRIKQRKIDFELYYAKISL